METAHRVRLVAARLLALAVRFYVLGDLVVVLVVRLVAEPARPAPFLLEFRLAYRAARLRRTGTVWSIVLAVLLSLQIPERALVEFVVVEVYADRHHRPRREEALVAESGAVEVENRGEEAVGRAQHRLEPLLVLRRPARVVAHHLRRFDEEVYLAVVERGRAALVRMGVVRIRVEDRDGLSRVALVARQFPDEREIVRAPPPLSDRAVELPRTDFSAHWRRRDVERRPRRAQKRVERRLPRFAPGDDHRAHPVEVSLRVCDAGMQEFARRRRHERRRRNRRRAKTPRYSHPVCHPQVFYHIFTLLRNSGNLEDLEFVRHAYLVEYDAALRQRRLDSDAGRRGLHIVAGRERRIVA